MSAESLENNLKQYICNTFDVEYSKRLPITIDGNNYICTLYLNQSDKPIIIQGEFESEDQFYNFMIKELNNRRMHVVSYYILQKELDHINESNND